MFTFIHLSSERKHDEWNIFLFFVLSFLPSCNRHRLRLRLCWHIELPAKGENWDVRTRKYSLSIIFCESKMLQMRNDKSEAPESSLDTKRLCLQETPRAFLGGRRFLIEIEVSLFVRQECLEVLGQDQFLLMPLLLSTRKPFCFEERSSAWRTISQPSDFNKPSRCHERVTSNQWNWKVT